MKLITIFIFAIANAAPIIVYPTDKDISERVICGSWMMKTEQNVLLKVGDSTFKPNVEYTTSSLIGYDDDKFTITGTDEKFYMNDFYNMMNYGNKFIIWPIDGSFKFYNCIKQDNINPKLTNETLTTIVKKYSIDVRGCINNVDCINIHCQDMVYVKDTLSCYPKTDNGNVLGYYINKNNDW